ncbi:unnamed protein product [Euphydryas editha]|uniref:Uncharacterized protein n=1 Tax=Euphydryas editha TaxID=104508 RepID=A0AAU9UB28_EUPED|nr:unnamed protein product [Euphydryas editha]
MSFGTSRGITGMPFNSPSIKTTPLSGARKLARHEASHAETCPGTFAHTLRGSRAAARCHIEKTRYASYAIRPNDMDPEVHKSRGEFSIHLPLQIKCTKNGHGSRDNNVRSALRSTCSQSCARDSEGTERRGDSTYYV